MSEQLGVLRTRHLCIISQIHSAPTLWKVDRTLAGIHRGLTIFGYLFEWVHIT